MQEIIDTLMAGLRAAYTDDWVAYEDAVNAADGLEKLLKDAGHIFARLGAFHIIIKDNK